MFVAIDAAGVHFEPEEVDRNYELFCPACGSRVVLRYGAVQ